MLKSFLNFFPHTHVNASDRILDTKNIYLQNCPVKSAQIFFINLKVYFKSCCFILRFPRMDHK